MKMESSFDKLRMNRHEPGLTKGHENQRDMNVPPIVTIDGVF
jgi:hypothetical protein